VLKSEDILELLTQLVNKSLVMTEARNGEIRYHMLETIRQFGNDKLQEANESESLRDRHLAYFVHLGEKAEQKLETAEQVSWLNRLEAELDNLRTALDWSMGGPRIEMGLRLATVLDNFWWTRGHQTEVIETLQNLLAHPNAAAHTLTRAKAFNVLSHLHAAPGNYHQISTAAREALLIGKELDDRQTVAEALFRLSFVSAGQGDHIETKALLEQALDIGRTSGDKRCVARSLQDLGITALLTSEYERAQLWFAEATSLWREIGDINSLSYTARQWGFALFHQHDHTGVLTKFHESLILNIELRDKKGIAGCLAAYAAVALARDQFIRAARLFGAVEALFEAIRIKLLPDDYDQYARNVTMLRSRLDEATFQKAWADGSAMTMDKAIEYALETEN
jgi:non-specific serine/threonine protein kinase